MNEFGLVISRQAQNGCYRQKASNEESDINNPFVFMTKKVERVGEFRKNVCQIVINCHPLNIATVFVTTISVRRRFHRCNPTGEAVLTPLGLQSAGKGTVIYAHAI